ncbi:unnamed protein product, partial [Urochloa humidicola]
MISCKKSTGGSASILTVLPEDFFQRVDGVSVICDDPEVATSTIKVPLLGRQLLL